MRKTVGVLSIAGLLALSSIGVAGASNGSKDSSRRRREPAQRIVGPVGMQHGDDDAHLPASNENMKLVSKLRLTDQAGGIADVSYHKGFAYVAAWTPECPNGGVHIVNVRKPRNPRKVAFAASPETDRPGEGVHVMSVNTRKFKGDLLVTNNEACDSTAGGAGGINLYDVTNPRKPKTLALGVGDTDPNDPEAEPWPTPNDVHSVQLFQKGRKAYAVLTDNFELLDVDIMDVSNPRKPKLIVETGLGDWPEAQDNLAFGDFAFHHDMWVKKIVGHWYLLASYWDAGYIVLNIDDPKNPQYVNDSDFPETDPLTGFSPPEGNAHQATWSRNNKWILGTDEDFSPYRPVFDITTGPNAGEYPAGEFGWTIPMATNFADGMMNGPTVFGGRACPPVADDPTTPEDETFVGDPLPPSPAEAGLTNLPEGEEAVLVVERGLCFFSEKVDYAQQAGYNAVIVGNSHAGSGDGAFPDAFLCGSQGHDFVITASGGCIGHRALHLLFNDPPEYEGADLPEIGTLGEEITMAPEFDAWGYLNLINADTLEHVDFYAPEEALDESLSHIFPLSIHETKVDPRGKNLAYASWYQLGARVMKFGNNGLEERGHFIDEGGNDFWGTFPVKRGRKRPVLLFSDRDFGLYVLKYTGPE